MASKGSGLKVKGQCIGFFCFQIYLLLFIVHNFLILIHWIFQHILYYFATIYCDFELQVVFLPSIHCVSSGQQVRFACPSISKHRYVDRLAKQQQPQHSETVQLRVLVQEFHGCSLFFTTLPACRAAAAASTRYSVFNDVLEFCTSIILCVRILMIAR